MNNRRKNNQRTVPEIIILGIIKLTVSIFSLIFRGRRKRGISQTERNEIIETRHQIENMLKSENIHELKQAVFDADKLVDRILKSSGYRGETFAERLKNAQGNIDHTLYENIWQGHKIRNQLAHEHELQIGNRELRSAIEKLLKYIKSI